MKQYIKILICSLFLLLGTMEATAQEVGYVNSIAVVNSMPETKVAQAQIDKFRKDLNTEYEGKVTAFQTKLAEAQRKAQNGEYTPVQQKEVENVLAAEERSLRTLESESMQKIKDRENSLYSPIYDKTNKVIAAIAKENNFKVILDSSAGIVLYAEENTDLTQRVIDKVKQ
jgi:outer membrane protein